MNDEWGGSIFPMVPGHEIVGIVTKVGAKVSRYKWGRVGVGCLVDSCRKWPCKGEQYCIEDHLTIMDRKRWTDSNSRGIQQNRGDENYILQIPDNLQWMVQHRFLRWYRHVSPLSMEQVPERKLA